MREGERGREFWRATERGKAIGMKDGNDEDDEGELVVMVERTRLLGATLVPAAGRGPMKDVGVIWG